MDVTRIVTEDERLAAACEAILFATGRAVSLDEISKAIGVDARHARAIMEQLRYDWNERCGGIEIIKVDDSWQMCTNKAYYPELITLEIHPRKPKLTDVLMETLAVIAYRQPVTKAEIERIRGVSSDHAVNRLVELELVEELGRSKQPGRPILFGTSKEFLRIFGLDSATDLPEINPLMKADFMAEAESEADSSEDVEIDV